MGSFKWTPQAHLYAENRVRFWALRVMTSLGIPWSDTHEREAIASDIWVDLLVRMERYDSKRSSPHTFIGHVVRHKGQELIAAAKRGKGLCQRRTVSLNAPITDDDGEEMELQDALSDDDGAVRRHDFGALERRLNDRIDVERAIQGLSDALAALCRQLKHESISEVARVRGVSRDVIYQEIREIRRVLRMRR